MRRKITSRTDAKCINLALSQLSVQFWLHSLYEEEEERRQQEEEKRQPDQLDES